MTMTNTGPERKKETIDTARLAAELRARRARLNLRQVEVAAMAATDQATISNIEAGKDTRISTLVRVAGALGLTLVLADSHSERAA